MQVNVLLQHRFYRTSDGSICTKDQFPYPFWLRYLEVFDQVNIGARLSTTNENKEELKMVNGDNVNFHPIAYYLGPKEFITNYNKINHNLDEFADNPGAFILRVGPYLSSFLEPKLRKRKKNYCLEVVGDPYDVFSPGSINNKLRPFFRWYFKRKLIYLCKNADAVAYVTKKALQKRYPPNPNSYTTFYSDVCLTKDSYSSSPKLFNNNKQTIKIGFVGTLAQLYKAPDVLIKAVAKCIREGFDMHLTIVGGGEYFQYLNNLAINERIDEKVFFLGQLSSTIEVRNALDKFDIFVLPSYQEGLPRAMIEAMARGLPCIGSNVGGIPELLSNDDTVLPGKVDILSNKLKEVVKDPLRMNKMAKTNFEKSFDYREEILKSNRLEFYNKVKLISLEN